MKKLTYTLLLVIVITLGGCDTTDDVTAIFLGRTWKLTEIMGDDDRPVDFWNGNEESANSSYALKDKAGNCVIIFSGMENGDLISGTFTGHGVNSTISGNWSANGKNQNFDLNLSAGGSESDVLAKNFIIGLNTADKYDGSTHTLKLNYTQDGKRRYLLCRPQN